ncbi:unnamed protein product, partial [Effrenium voratum]
MWVFRYRHPWGPGGKLNQSAWHSKEMAARAIVLWAGGSWREQVEAEERARSQTCVPAQLQAAEEEARLTHAIRLLRSKFVHRCVDLQQVRADTSGWRMTRSLIDILSHRLKSETDMWSGHVVMLALGALLGRCNIPALCSASCELGCDLVHRREHSCCSGHPATALLTARHRNCRQSPKAVCGTGPPALSLGCHLQGSQQLRLAWRAHLELAERSATPGVLDEDSELEELEEPLPLA